MPEPTVQYTNKLKKRMPEAGFLNWADERGVDDQIDDVVMGALLTKNRVIRGLEVSHDAGLNVNFTEGVVEIAGFGYRIDAGTLALTPATTTAEQVNWIYVDNTGTVIDATDPPSGDYIPLALADTDDTTVLRVADLRPFAADSGEVENDCINGTFDIWQRGTTQTTPNYGSADRWSFAQCSASNPAYRVEFPDDSTDIPSNPRYYSRFQVDAPAGLNIYRMTKLLYPRKYAGKRVYVSFYARASIDVPSRVWVINDWWQGTEYITLSTVWEKYTVFFDVPEVPAGQVIGSLDYTRIIIYCSTSSDPHAALYDLAEVEVYAADTEMHVRRKSAQETFKQCEEYYQVISGDMQGSGYWSDYNFRYNIALNFRTTMIRNPHTIIPGSQPYCVNAGYIYPVSFDSVSADGYAKLAGTSQTPYGLIALNTENGTAYDSDI